MPRVIDASVMSLNAGRNLNTSRTAPATAPQRLFGGLRIFRGTAEHRSPDGPAAGPAAAQEGVRHDTLAV